MKNFKIHIELNKCFGTFIEISAKDEKSAKKIVISKYSKLVVDFISVTEVK